MTLEDLFSSVSPRSYDCSVSTQSNRCDPGNVYGKCGGLGSNATDCPGPLNNTTC